MGCTSSLILRNRDSSLSHSVRTLAILVSLISLLYAQVASKQQIKLLGFLTYNSALVSQSVTLVDFIMKFTRLVTCVIHHVSNVQEQHKAAQLVVSKVSLTSMRANV